MKKRRISEQTLMDAMALLKAEGLSTATIPDVTRALRSLVGVAGSHAAPSAVQRTLRAYGWSKAGHGRWSTAPPEPSCPG